MSADVTKHYDGDRKRSLGALPSSVARQRAVITEGLASVGNSQERIALSPS